MVASRQDLLLNRNTQLVKGTSGHSFRPSRSHNQPALCSKSCWRKRGQCHVPWWDLGCRTQAAFTVHIAEIMEGAESWREHGVCLCLLRNTDWGRRPQRLPT